MTKFYYVKSKEGEVFLARSRSYDGWCLDSVPEMFSSRQKAFAAFEDYRTRVKAAGESAALLEIKITDL